MKRLNKIYKLAKLIRKKREAQMINIRNETENNTIDPIDIKMIKKENKGVLYLYANE